MRGRRATARGRWHAGALPAQVRDLVVAVKHYERKTIDAARDDAARRARRTRWRTIPLVPSRELASDSCVDELGAS